MKIKIEYQYDSNSNMKFRASATVGDNRIWAISNKGFEDVREKLLVDVKEIIQEMPVVIPEPEEVEL